MTLSIIVAMAQNRVIGKNNQLPWHLSEDLKHFKATTMGHPIAMGRKTYESIGKPLPGRENIILSRNPHYQPTGTTVIASLDQLSSRDADQEIFIIGGAQIYEQALAQAEKLYLTLIEQEFDGDTYFPKINWDEFKVTNETERLYAAKNQLPYRFVEAERIL